MSLLNTCSPFTSGIESTKKGDKRQPKLIQTFQNIKNEYKEPVEQQPDSFEQLKQTNDSRMEKIQKLIIAQESNAGEDLADYSAPKKLSPMNGASASASAPSPPPSGPQMPANTSDNTVISREPFSKPAHLHTNRGSSYSESYGPIPYYSHQSSQRGAPSAPMANSSSQLMEKLNYMIHLLEEQQKEPTQNIMEEFVLYGLLGVFMIYLVDSFARAGKYIR
jgi:hypothetical protein